MSAIENHLALYNERMSRSMDDKMYFLPLLKDKIDVLVDFGCADGFLLRETRKRDDKLILLGYDNNKLQVRKAKERFIKNASFFVDFPQLLDYTYGLKRKGLRIAFNLSSVLHELHSHYNNPSLDYLYSTFLGFGFDYVCVRDMGITVAQEFEYIPMTRADDIAKVLKLADPVNLREFHDRYGKFEKGGNFIHFLLKYKYKENWWEEVRENYLVDMTILKERFGEYGYKVEHFKHYSLPFTADRVKKDFDIEFDDPTHFQLIGKYNR